MSQKLYRLLAVISVVSIMLAGAAAPASASNWRDKVDPWVLQTTSQGETEFLVYLTSQADLSAADALPTKLEKGRFVYQALSSLAERTQAPLIAVLDQLGVQYRSYWVTNMIWVRGSLSTIQLLSARPDVAKLYANPTVTIDPPVVQNSPDAAPSSIEWNISWVNAPQVWALGYSGQGVVIGGQDTGYQWDHPALINHYRGWDGTTADHNYNWHDAIHGTGDNLCGYDTLAPCDDYGHGTHTMGTMVGDDGGTNQIGIAPGARWIGCRNMDQGAGTPATYTECYQFFIAPTDLQGKNPNPDLAPDVINNSWSCPPSEGCNPNSLLLPVQNMVAAGIVSAHSAGNSGSGCSTISDPAAIYDESFTVGATGDHSDTLAGFSSRGPVSVDGSGRLKPDISAPGVNIRSSVPNNQYQSLSGTSMAGPHVAGVVALLLSARPELRGHVTEIESVIEQSAVHISSTQCSSSGVPNNLYGWGRIDALAMVQWFHMLQLNKVASAPSVGPGDVITYTLTITHIHEVSPTTNVLLTDTLPTNTSFVSATLPFTHTGDTIQWGFPSLDPMESQSVNLAVRVDISATGTITNSDYAVYSDQMAWVSGPPVTTRLLNEYFLPVTVKGP